MAEDVQHHIGAERSAPTGSMFLASSPPTRSRSTTGGSSSTPSGCRSTRSRMGSGDIVGLLTDGALGATSCCRSTGTSTKRRKVLV